MLKNSSNVLMFGFVLIVQKTAIENFLNWFTWSSLLQSWVEHSVNRMNGPNITVSIQKPKLCKLSSANKKRFKLKKSTRQPG